MSLNRVLDVSRVLAALVVSTGACGSAVAEPSGSTQEPPLAAPAARLGHSMVYDEARHRVLLFGGSVFSNTFFGDLWSWNGTAWIEIAASGPPARENAVVVYDRARARVVLFGGAGRENGAPKQFADTWEYDGTQWTPRVSASSPGFRHHAVGAFDPARNRVVVFGGFDASSAARRDTWEWDGAEWTSRGNDGPANQNPVAAVFAPSLGRVVALLADFASFDARGWADAALWQWDGTRWTKVAGSDTRVPAPSPMLALAASDGILLYHGGGAGGPAASLQWTGSAWTPLAGNPPSARIGAAAAFDGARQRVVLFGGATLAPERALSDTWEWSRTDGWNMRR